MNSHVHGTWFSSCIGGISSEEEEEEDEVDLSGIRMKKCLVNLSKYKLSRDETSLLAKGLNFAVSPKHMPVEDLGIATE